MKLLLDTHVLLWAAAEPDRLKEPVREMLSDPDNELFFSAASIWEVAIKSGLGRPEFSVDPNLLRRGLVDRGYLELAISAAHAAAVMELPPLHKDPFDRLIVAQARHEGFLLLTADEMVAAYGGSILFV
ncbi:type II toxin-antitoxin system VapC family toxin [Rhizobium sp. S-51]|uniref:Type II toxin-antitoxin system VapC family toxin n=1 Tax=Rhizobium terricola TaxID=2728849 RepID=A0A7Y0AW31_9HYPH|nr:type II toxin-antitoxin system VapC family toxin [Rhizobium terricola]NML74560.1 type II toxin-antitoxin system VapC family toxin [Rhizobium terricola]